MPPVPACHGGMGPASGVGSLAQAKARAHQQQQEVGANRAAAVVGMYVHTCTGQGREMDHI